MLYFTAPGELHLCMARHYNGRTCTRDIATVTQADLAKGMDLVAAAPGHRDFTGDGARLAIYRLSANGSRQVAAHRDVPVDIASNSEAYDFARVLRDALSSSDPKAPFHLQYGATYELRLYYNVPFAGSPGDIGTTRFTYSQTG